MEQTASLKLLAVFKCPPQFMYEAWLDSKQHTAMTGSQAEVSKKIGGKFTVWDRYASGKNLKLVQNRLIVQSWRSADFSEDADDSLLEISFIKTASGCAVTLIHKDLPAQSAAAYKNGWKEFYFEPMKKWAAENYRPAVKKVSNKPGKKK